MDKSKMKIVYVITNRKGRHYWNRCGVAFVNGDGSINVKLESIPVNGEMQIRVYVRRDESALADIHRASSDDGAGESAPLAESA